MKEINKELLAKEFFKFKILQFNINNPVKFKSGLVSPVYMDNRALPFNPLLWASVLDGISYLFYDVHFDIIAGVETASIPHSATLGYKLKKPSVFIRKEAKNHGTKKMIEGGSVKNKKVILIEDMITTGSSSLSAIENLKIQGAIVEYCCCISSYELKGVEEKFNTQGIKLKTLLPFKFIFDSIKNELDKDTIKAIADWIESINKKTIALRFY